MQLLQLSEPNVFVYLPAGHGKHTVEPALSEYEPNGHGIYDEEPDREYVPGHFWQEVASSSYEYVPAGQGTHPSLV